MAPQCKLTYFDARALGEPIRYLLAYGSIEYEEVRIKYEQWPSVKSNMPFGKVPVFEEDGKVIHQSTAICRYLGKKLGLAGGQDDWAALEIDAVADTIADLRTAIVNYSFYTDEPEKPKKREILLGETIPFYLTRLEKLVKDNGGYFAHGKLSYADVIFAALEEFLSGCMESDLLEGYPNLKSLVEKVNSNPEIKAWINKRPKTRY
ncbi:hypothetical protein R5R35_003179 [Gryllus longicercus]|uniref:glutathione transferase n=1 Tax=Gryllus longicercus TaxID=2509291 RepID=A0AAN9VWJ2_9ORTH